MSTFVRIAMMIMIIVSASSCARVRTEVTRFHSLDPNETVKTFVVLPYEEQKGSLEFQNYASLASEQLARKGYRNVDTIRDARYAVFLEYAVDGGTTTTTIAPIFGQTGGGTSTFSGSTSGMVGQSLSKNILKERNGL